MSHYQPCISARPTAGKLPRTTAILPSFTPDSFHLQGISFSKVFLNILKIHPMLLSRLAQSEGALTGQNLSPASLQTGNVLPLSPQKTLLSQVFGSWYPCCNVFYVL